MIKTVKNIHGTVYHYDDSVPHWKNTYPIWIANNKEIVVSLHREDGPAVEYIDGDFEWWVNGLRHREDGPSCEYYTESFFQWYLNDMQYSFEAWCFITKKNPEEVTYLKLKYNIDNSQTI